MITGWSTDPDTAVVGVDRSAITADQRSLPTSDHD
jgi:hypothetical protein